VGSGRGVHGKENPRKFYAVGLRAEPALIVRGSSRRITIMRFRPANIRVINRREDYLDHDPGSNVRNPQEGKRKQKKKNTLDSYRPSHGRSWAKDCLEVALSSA